MSPALVEFLTFKPENKTGAIKAGGYLATTAIAHSKNNGIDAGNFKR